jgi:hypothetical protein
MLTASKNSKDGFNRGEPVTRPNYRLLREMKENEDIVITVCDMRYRLVEYNDGKVKL